MSDSEFRFSEWMHSRRLAPGKTLHDVWVTPIAALLLLRWAEYVEAEERSIAEFDGREHVPALPKDAMWQAWSELRGQDLRGVLSEVVIPAVSRANGSAVAQVLPKLTRPLEKLLDQDVEWIEKVVGWVASLPFDTAEERHAAGEKLGEILGISVGVSTRDGRQHTTPDSIVAMIVGFAEPRPGERVYDPCFGTGGLLVSAAKRLREAAKQLPPSSWHNVQTASIFGVEKDPTAYVVGLARVVLAGIDRPGLEIGDALERPLVRNGAQGFDCILAVPPWGARSKSEVAGQFSVGAASMEMLFLQHVMGSLRAGGRAVVALPEGALFRAGADRDVRRQLLSEFRVEQVMSLPADAFQPLTAVKSSLVVFRRASPRDSVRFHVVRPFAEWVALGSAERDDASQNSVSGRDFWDVPIEQLARRDWELVAKRTGEDELSTFLQNLKAASAEVDVRPLGEVAQVFAGVPYTQKSTTTDRNDAAVSAGLVRVADVKPPVVRRPSLYITAAAERRPTTEQRLRTGDVLVTVSGSIGKIGLFNEDPGAIGAVAANSIAVIRGGDDLAPAYLCALLGSEGFQTWLRGHARGGTIRHLSIRTLRDLPVPLLPIQLQERVAREPATKRGDVLMYLFRVLMGAADDPVAAWLEADPVAQDVRASAGSGESGSSVELLSRFCHSLDGIARESSSDQVGPEMGRWLSALKAAVSPLTGLAHVPAGPARLALVEACRLALQQARNTSRDATLPAAEDAEQLMAGIEILLRRESEALLGVARLNATVDPPAIVVGAEAQVHVTLRNVGLLPLRHVTATTTPNLGTWEEEYLQEGEGLLLVLSVPPQRAPGVFSFEVVWRAERLDGRAVTGTIALALEVQSTRSAVSEGDLGASPYIVGSPVDREEMFFGRAHVVDQIRRQVDTSHRANVILLEGNRRTGKTSILKRLQAPGVLPGWIVVYCSFQEAEGHPTAAGVPTQEVFRLMTRTIALATYDAGVSTWLPGEDPPAANLQFRSQLIRALVRAFDTDRPFERFELYIQSALDAIQPRRLLLMLDEFDKLQEGIDNGVTSPQVPENIRYLLHAHPGISAILVGGFRLKRLREEYWSALFGFGHRILVSALPFEDARLLVTRPVEGRLTYVPEARDRIVSICAGQPFVIQSLCNRVFERAARTGARTVTVSAVDEAAAEMVRPNEHFQTLWGYAGSDRRRLLLALAEQLEVGPDPITLSLLEARLEALGVPTIVERLGEDIEFLRELELLELETMSGVSVYRLAVPLMGDWIRANIDFDDIQRRAVREGEETLQ